MKKYYYERLFELRDEHDMVQKEIADILKTSAKQYSRWETGEREIPVHHLITLANLYKVSIDYIMGGTDKKEINI